MARQRSSFTGRRFEEAEQAPLGMDLDILAYMNLENQDTEIKKRNRAAQRNHRARWSCPILGRMMPRLTLK